MRQFAVRALPVTAAVVLGATMAASGPGGSAAAASRAQDATLTMHAGGDRSGATGATVPGGPPGVLFTVRNANGTVDESCPTVSGGTCSVNVPNGQTYTVTQSAVSPPAGWFSSADLGVGTSTTLTAANYSRVSVTVPANAGTATISVSPTGATDSTTTNNALRSGTWAVSRDNPPEPAHCGLDVALLFDLSGSVQPYLGQYKEAGEAFVRALEETPSRVALFTFGTDAPAANNPNFPLTSVTTATQAAPLITRIRTLNADGGTNWDRGIWQIAASTQHYDVAVVLTDGNPTYFGAPFSGPGSRTRFAEVENGIFSANALKLKGTRIIAVGIGAFESLTGSLDNLKAISGKTPGSDYIATSFAGLSPVLKALALTNCAGLEIEKSAAIKDPAADRYDRVGQQVRYTYTVTNPAGKFFTLTNVTVTNDRIHGPIHCDATTLAPGASTTCTVVYTITQADLDAGRVTNVASATGTATNGTPVLSDEVDTTVRADQRPAISIVKTASVHSFAGAGLLITYFYRVTNTGNVTLVTTARDNAAAPLVCPRSVLPPGRSMACRSYHVVTAADVAAGHIPTVAIATGKAPDGTEVHADARLDIPGVNAPAISIFKLASAFTFATAGTPVTYYYLVVNSGNAALDPVAVTDSRGLPVSCPHTALALGEEMTCTAHYVTTQADVDRGTIANTGTVTGRAPDGAEVTDGASLDIPAMPAPALSIVKTASPVTFSGAGQLITYSYLVTNNGNASLHGVTVADSRGLALSCPSTSLAAGQAMTCTARYRTTQADVSVGPIINVALVQGTTPNGVVLGDASVAFVFPTVFFFPVTG